MFTLFQRISLSIIGLSLFGAVGAQAAAVRIECPLAQSRTQITSPLPTGWWQTPQLGNLKKTKIAAIGGVNTLMCGYGAYGTTVYVMKKAPAGAICTPNATGFTCATAGIVVPLPKLVPIIPKITIPILPAPKTYKTGSITLKQTWMMDLDKGTTGSGAGSDIWFQAVTATQRYLVPQNGAKIAIAGNRSINLAGCRTIAGYSGARMPIQIFREGLYVCVKTNKGRISQFRVNKAPGASPGKMELGYTTWAN